MDTVNVAKQDTTLEEYLLVIRQYLTLESVFLFRHIHCAIR